MFKHLSTRKDIGIYGENIACKYLVRHNFEIIARNVARKTGEIDIIGVQSKVLHFFEVKTISTKDIQNIGQTDRYDPSVNLHAYKIHKVARTAEWYMAEIGWMGESQIDGILVWVELTTGVARVRYLPHIL